MKYHLANALAALGALVIFLGLFGSVGAVDADEIGLGQALIQILVSVGIGLVCFGIRWLLCREKDEK